HESGRPSRRPMDGNAETVATVRPGKPAAVRFTDDKNIRHQFTVIVSVPMVCVVATPAPLACTVMVNDTGDGGAGGGLTPPPPPQEVRVKNNKAEPIRTATGAARRGLLRHIFIASTNPAASVMPKSQNMPNRPVGNDHGAGVPGGETAGRELTCTVSVSEALPLAGRFTVVGLKLQVVPLGTFKHWKFTVPVAPYCGLSVMAKLADCPTESVAEVGEMLPVKLGGGITSVAVTLVVSEPLVAVTVKG